MKSQKNDGLSCSLPDGREGEPGRCELAETQQGKVSVRFLWRSSSVQPRHEFIIRSVYATTMSTPTLKAAILIVSTTASKDPSTDSSGNILQDVFEQEGGGKWEVTERKIVGDVVLDIQRSIIAWTDQIDSPNVIITTGGTGFAIHDTTPEVC